MTGLTRHHTVNTNVPVMGHAIGRTAWIIYNGSGASVYWGNTKVSSDTSGFLILNNGSFSAKIPEDDPEPEVWVYPNGAGIYIYEGFGKVG